MTKPKYQVGDRFGGWVVVHVSFLKSYVYKLHNNFSDNLLVVGEPLIDKVFADFEYVPYQEKTT